MKSRSSFFGHLGYTGLNNLQVGHEVKVGIPMSGVESVSLENKPVPVAKLVTMGTVDYDPNTYECIFLAPKEVIPILKEVSYIGLNGSNVKVCEWTEVGLGCTFRIRMHRKECEDSIFNFKLVGTEFNISTPLVKPAESGLRPN